MLTITQERKLTQEENDYLNKLDNRITMIMLNTEKKRNSQETSPWSPELYIVIRKVTLWKLTLTKLKTNISQHKTITSIQQTLKIIIDITWKTSSDIFHQRKSAKFNLIQIRKESIKLRTNYLIQSASAMDIVNNKAEKNTITNINKIEQIIKMWKVIQFTTSKRTISSIQTSYINL